MVRVKTVMVTGSTGFIGAALTKRLLRDRYHVVEATRSNVGNIDGHTSWDGSFSGVDVECVIHLAARVHAIQELSADPLRAYRDTNVAGTKRLAEYAAASGVKRFIYLSSIKVNGETTGAEPFTATDRPSPNDPYGQSKAEAEAELRAISIRTGLDVVIIRPPLVYGPGVKANFLSMMRWLNRGTPLPLGAIRNQRSLVALDNLVDLIVTCLRHPAAVNQILLVSDGEDLSTPALLRRTAAAMGKHARLVPIPTPILRTVAGWLGKRDLAQRLCGSLQVDIRKTRDLLDWSPPVSVDEALSQTARHFEEHRRD